MTLPICRGKFVLGGGFIEGYMCYTPVGDVPGIQDKKTREFIPVIPKTIGRFTGRYDVAGKPVYEGDIVTYSTGLWVVEYNAGKMGFVFRNLRSGGILPGYAVTAAATVAGNIHDNPEIMRTKRLKKGV